MPSTSAIDRVTSPRRLLLEESVLPAARLDPEEQRHCVNPAIHAPGAPRSDVIVDGGNSHWEDSRRRHGLFAGRGIRFLDVGTSGGSRYGACYMAGGDRDAYAIVEPLLKDLAFDEQAMLFVGPPGSAIS